MSNEVNIFNNQNFSLENFENLATSILNQTLKITAKKGNNYEIAVIFIDEKTSLNLNHNYRKKDYVADVLSFANRDENSFNHQENNDLGDVYICFPKAKKQSEEYQHSLTRELSFLFLHGLLHNLGYDHETKEDEETMFNLQRIVLKQLKIFRV